MQNNAYRRSGLLLLLIIALALTTCRDKDKHDIVIHLVPYNYEGPLIESLQLRGRQLKRSGDSIFIAYDERGVAIYRDTIVHFSGIQEKYFYAKDGHIVSPEIMVDKKDAYHGICANGHPFYAVIIQRYNSSMLNFKKVRRKKVNEYICDH